MVLLMFQVPVPASTKNSRRLVRMKSGRLRSFASTKAKHGMANVAAAARQALAALGLDKQLPLFVDDRVLIHVDHHPDTELVEVRIMSLGPKVKGRTGRGRDVQNIGEGICDALKGIVYTDDRQVDEITLRRCHKAKP